MSFSYNQARLDRLNFLAKLKAEKWRREELPKVRMRIIASGIIPIEAIQDDIVSLSDFLNDPFEIWQQDWWTMNWRRIEWGMA